MPDTKADILRTYIQQFCADNAVIFTDESGCYNGLDKYYAHRYINHSELQFSEDGITTNTIEGFWGQFKRMVFGTYPKFPTNLYLWPGFLRERVSVRGLAGPAVRSSVPRPCGCT